MPALAVLARQTLKARGSQFVGAKYSCGIRDSRGIPRLILLRISPVLATERDRLSAVVPPPEPRLDRDSRSRG